MLAFYLAAIETQEARDFFTSPYKEYRGFMYHIANEILETITLPKMPSTTLLSA